MATGVQRFSWTEEYSVHVEDLDVQHRRLTGLLAELHFGALSGHPAPRVARALDDFIRYAQIHFADEEQFMERHGYPALADHRTHHQRLLDRFTAVQTNQALTGELSSDTVGGMFGWLEEHVKEVDLLYCQYFDLRGPELA